MRGSRLIFALVTTLALVACGGEEAVDVSSPTPAPTEATTASPAATGDAIEVEAEDLQFETDTISATAGSTVSVELKNRDSVPHNIAFYETDSGTGEIYVGETITGPDAEVTYTFQAPSAPGDYFFRCNVHPQMTGTFRVS